MGNSSLWLRISIAVLVVFLLGSPLFAVADTYTIYNIGSDDSGSLYGIDDSGNLVIRSFDGCAPSVSHCFDTYHDGVLVSTTSSAPSLAFDNGTPCATSPPGLAASDEVCNNGRVGFAANNGGSRGIYTGVASSPLELPLTGFVSVDGDLLDALGDFAWDNGAADELYEAYDDTAHDSDPPAVPEPSTLLLMGSGVAVLTGTLRSRFRS